MKIRLASPISNHSTADGLGFRIVIWNQGCSCQCPGCHNPETWKMTGGLEKDTKELIDFIQKNKGIWNNQPIYNSLKGNKQKQANVTTPKQIPYQCKHPHNKCMHTRLMSVKRTKSPELLQLIPSIPIHICWVW